MTRVVRSMIQRPRLGSQFLAPGFGLGLALPLWAFEERTGEWEFSVYLSKEEEK